MIKPMPARMILLAILPIALGACTHLRGVVLSEHTEHPIPNAQFTIGRPDMMVMESHNADRTGHFDFYINPLDETNVYVWDGKGDPAVGVLHIDRLDISDHMVVHMQDPNNPFVP